MPLNRKLKSILCGTALGVIAFCGFAYPAGAQASEAETSITMETLSQLGTISGTAIACAVVHEDLFVFETDRAASLAASMVRSYVSRNGGGTEVPLLVVKNSAEVASMSAESRHETDPEDFMRACFLIATNEDVKGMFLSFRETRPEPQKSVPKRVPKTTGADRERIA